MSTGHFNRNPIIVLNDRFIEGNVKFKKKYLYTYHNIKTG